MQVIDLTEKQAKKLLNECNSEFRQMVDLLQIEYGRIHIRDLSNILKFGMGFNNNHSSTRALLNEDIKSGSI
jgi:hypothetical protein